VLGRYPLEGVHVRGIYSNWRDVRTKVASKQTFTQVRPERFRDGAEDGESRHVNGAELRSEGTKVKFSGCWFSGKDHGLLSLDNGPTTLSALQDLCNSCHIGDGGDYR
jgi:hypothetical protein